jgi:hypothetical protein
MRRQWVVKGKGKGFPLQVWSGSWGSRRSRLLDLLDIQHYEGGKVVTLTHRPPSPPAVFLALIFRGWVDTRAHGSVGSLGKNPQRHHRWSIPRPSDLFNLVTRWEWMGNDTPRPLYPRERDPAPITQETVWAPGSVRTGEENFGPPEFDPRPSCP